MNQKLIALDTVAHRQHGWQPPQHLAFAARQAVAPVLLQELAAVVPFYPLAFAKQADGSFVAVVLQGLQQGENLCVAPDGRWRTPYIPSHYRGYPFVLRPSRVDGALRSALCFDQGSGLYRQAPVASKGEVRFFDDEGKPHSQLEKLMNFLQACEHQRQLTQTAADALDNARVLVPWVLPKAMQSADAQPLLRGLFRIDEEALNRLDAQALDALRKANALPLAFAQLLSMPRLVLLQQWAKERPPLDPVPDLAVVQKIFEQGQSDTIRFNW